MTYEHLGLRLPEIGKVKIGQKGAEKMSKQGNKMQQPEKLDHFRITSLERGPDKNYLVDHEVHQAIGEEKPTKLIVRFLSKKIEENMVAGWARYIGGELVCAGDGKVGEELSRQTGEIIQKKCPCENISLDKDPCKMCGKAFFTIDGGRLGGYYSIGIKGKTIVPGFVASLQSLINICDRAGGSIAGVPVEMRLLNYTHKKFGKVYYPAFQYLGDLAAASKMRPETNFGILLSDEEPEADDADCSTDDCDTGTTPAATAPSTDSKDQKDPKDQKETKDVKEPKAAKKPESRPAEQPASKPAAQPQTETAKPTTPAAPSAQQKGEVAAGQQSGVEAPKADAPKAEAPKTDAPKTESQKAESDNQGQSAGDKDGGKNGVAAGEPQPEGEKKPITGFWCDSCERIANEYSKPGTCKCGCNIWHEAANMKAAQEAIAKRSAEKKSNPTGQTTKPLVFWCQNCLFVVETSPKPEKCNCEKPHWHITTSMEAAKNAIDALTGKTPGERLAESGANRQQNIDTISSCIKRVFGSSTGPAVCKQISLLLDRNISASADLCEEDVEELLELMGVITEMPKNDRDAFIIEWKRGRAERLAAEMGANA